MNALLNRIRDAQVAIFAEPETAWYRTGDVEREQTEFLLQDPDDYLLRFGEFLGERPVP